MKLIIIAFILAVSLTCGSVRRHLQGQRQLQATTQVSTHDLNELESLASQLHAKIQQIKAPQQISSWRRQLDEVEVRDGDTIIFVDEEEEKAKQEAEKKKNQSGSDIILIPQGGYKVEEADGSTPDKIVRIDPSSSKSNDPIHIELGDDVNSKDNDKNNNGIPDGQEPQVVLVPYYIEVEKTEEQPEPEPQPEPTPQPQIIERIIEKPIYIERSPVIQRQPEYSQPQTTTTTITTRTTPNNAVQTTSYGTPPPGLTPSPYANQASQQPAQQPQQPEGASSTTKISFNTQTTETIEPTQRRLINRPL